MYHKFQIAETDRFDAAHFPELQTSLITLAGILTGEPGGPMADMLLSYVKDHSINSQYVVNHPRLTTLISTRELPIGVMEDLFEASRKNPAFRQDLESYIRSGLE